MLKPRSFSALATELDVAALSISWSIRSVTTQGMVSGKVADLCTTFCRLDFFRLHVPPQSPLTPTRSECFKGLHSAPIYNLRYIQPCFGIFWFT